MPTQLLQCKERVVPEEDADEAVEEVVAVLVEVVVPVVDGVHQVVTVGRASLMVQVQQV